MNAQSTIETPGRGFAGLATAVALVDTIATHIRILVARVRLMEQVRKERALLATMSAQILHDIGVDAVTAEQEAAQSCLNLPLGR